MSMIEVEIKSLLQTEEKAQLFAQELEKLNFVYKDREDQLNHYFLGRLTQEILDSVSPSAKPEDISKLSEALKAEKQSVRTRQIIKDDPRDPVVLLIVKSAISGTSENGTIRVEYEIPVNCSLERLDQFLLDGGLVYQSKWSRERKTYILKGRAKGAVVDEYLKSPVTATIDKNAGYGYLAELEMLCDKEQASKIRDFLLNLLAETNFRELPADRLDRMFSHYNDNWRSYYGTNNVFTVE